MWIDTVEVVDSNGETVCLRIVKRTGGKDITETLSALCSFPELLEMAKELATTGGSPSLRAKAKALVAKLGLAD